MFVLSLPLLGELESEAMLEDFPDSLQRHALDVWVEEDDEKPTQEAYSAVEAKCARRSDAFHHRKERAANYDVRAPASRKMISKTKNDGRSISLWNIHLRYGVQHSSQCTSFIGDELSADPSNRCYTSGVESNVADDCYEDQGAGPTDF